VGSAVTSRHPSKELSVVDDEVGEGELVRVEDEWRDTQTEDSHPEVNDVGDEDGHGNVKQQYQRSHTEVNRGTGESRATSLAQDPNEIETGTY
jgi:hypothetical protein